MGGDGGGDSAAELLALEDATAAAEARVTEEAETETPGAKAKGIAAKGKAKCKPKAKGIMKRPAAQNASSRKKAKAEGRHDEEEAMNEETEENETLPEEKKKKENKKETAKKENKKENKKDEKANDKDKKEKKEKEKKEKEKKEGQEKKTGKSKDEEKAKQIQLTQSSEDEEEPKAPGTETAEEKRDTKKAYVFNKMLHTLPEQVQQIFADKQISRQEKTKLVNSMVEVNEHGKHVLKKVEDCDVAMAMSRQYRITKGKEKAKGYPRCVIAAKLGGEMQLERALQSGEVIPVEDKGKIFYCIQSISISTETGNQQSVQMQQAPRQLQDSEQDALTAFFDNFEPAFGSAASADGFFGSQRSQPKQPKRLMDGMSLAGQQSGGSLGLILSKFSF